MKKSQEDVAIEFDYAQVWYDYCIPVLRNSEIADLLVGTIEGYKVSFFKDGIFQKVKQHWQGNVRSTNPPYEEFEISSKEHYNSIDLYKGIVMIKFSANGNNGTHYSGTWKYNLTTGSFATLIRALPG